MTKHKIQVYFLSALLFMTILLTPDLLGQSKSVIGLTVYFSAPKGPVENADKIYFIKLDEDSDILKTKSVLKSNFRRDNQIYLTNVEPGRYAIVAIEKEKLLPIYGLTELTCCFSEALIKESIVTVNSNDFVNMGNYNLSTEMMVSNKESDDAQVHFYRLITGKKRIPGYMQQVSLDTWYYRAGIKNAEISMSNNYDFLIKALKHFQGLEQEEIIRRKVDKKQMAIINRNTSHS